MKKLTNLIKFIKKNLSTFVFIFSVFSFIITFFKKAKAESASDTKKRNVDKNKKNSN